MAENGQCLVLINFPKQRDNERNKHTLRDVVYCIHWAYSARHALLHIFDVVGVRGQWWAEVALRRRTLQVGSPWFTMGG